MKAFRASAHGRPVLIYGREKRVGGMGIGTPPALSGIQSPFARGLEQNPVDQQVTVSVMPTVCQMIPPPKRGEAAGWSGVFRDQAAHMAAMMAQKGTLGGIEIGGDDQGPERYDDEGPAEFFGRASVAVFTSRGSN